MSAWGRDIPGYRYAPTSISKQELKALKDEAADAQAVLEKTLLELEKKRKASEDEKEALNEKICLLLPPKSVKNDYIEQKPAKYVFKCSDGDIQIPEYGILQTEFYYQQSKAREKHANGNIYNYKQFPRSSVKYFTDALFGVMPKCNDIVGTIQLMNFLLFEGQADADFGSNFEIKFLENIWKQLKRMVDERLAEKGTALVIFYFLSLNKNEFDEFARDLSKLTTLSECYAMAWMFSIGHSFEGEYGEIETFLRKNCQKNGWDIQKWLKTQSGRAQSLFKPKAKAKVQATNDQAENAQ